MTEQDKNVPSSYLKINSVIEKDESGNIVAKGRYFDESKHITSNCLGSVSSSANINYNHVGDTELSLDDMHGSPYIACFPTYFVADTNN